MVDQSNRQSPIYYHKKRIVDRLIDETPNRCDLYEIRLNKNMDLANLDHE